MFGLSMTELLVVLAVALLVIGPKQLPQLAKTLGKTLRDVRRATDDLRDTFEREVMEETRPKIRPNPSSVAARSPTLTDGGETPNRALTANAPPAPLGHDVPADAPVAASPAADGATPSSVAAGSGASTNGSAASTTSTASTDGGPEGAHKAVAGPKSSGGAA